MASSNRTSVITVVGFKYQKGRPSPSILKTGKITFDRQPDNPYDVNAILVSVNGIPVGHVSKDNNVNFPKVIISAECLELYGASAKLTITFENSEENKNYKSLIINEGSGIYPFKYTGIGRGFPYERGGEYV